MELWQAAQWKHQPTWRVFWVDSQNILGFILWRTSIQVKNLENCVKQLTQPGKIAVIKMHLAFRFLKIKLHYLII